MPRADPTTLLTEWRNGNREALDELFPLVSEDLRARAHVARAQSATGLGAVLLDALLKRSRAVPQP